jgi:hypothetical protein
MGGTYKEYLEKYIIKRLRTWIKYERSLLIYKNLQFFEKFTYIFLYDKYLKYHSSNLIDELLIYAIALSSPKIACTHYYLQRGQVEFVFLHWIMHELWKNFLQV